MKGKNRRLSQPKKFLSVSAFMVIMSFLWARKIRTDKNLKAVKNEVNGVLAPTVERRRTLDYVTQATAIVALIFAGVSSCATYSQLGVSQDTEVTARYAQAVGQIGTEGPAGLQIRLGGIYSLGRLAEDSHRDQPTIIEVLSAFIRTHVNQARPEPEATDCAPGRNLDSAINDLDVQAALAVLGGRNRAWDGGAIVDLRLTCLIGANLKGADLDGADLTNSNMSSANLDGANLANARLVAANLSKAVLHGANLSGANLGDSSLIGANLVDADLRESQLNLCFLNDADLRGADFSGSKNQGVVALRTVHDSSTKGAPWLK